MYSHNFTGGQMLHMKAVWVLWLRSVGVNKWHTTKNLSYAFMLLVALNIVGGSSKGFKHPNITVTVLLKMSNTMMLRKF